VAKAHLVLWGVGTVLITTLYGLQDTKFIPRFLFTISFAGVVGTTASYLLTEFALRPVAARSTRSSPPALARNGVQRSAAGPPVMGAKIAR
jgi:adenylate cyclase